MPATLVAAALMLPADLVEVRAGDVDGDGRDELVLISRHDEGVWPDSVTLTVVHVGDDGVEQQRHSLALGNAARLWDIEGGAIWLVDGKGVARLHLDGRIEHVAERTTPLSGLGPTTPRAVDVAHDLDGDGQADVLAFSRGVLDVIAHDGRSWGVVAAPAEGAVGTLDRAGGTVLSSASRMPSVAVGDVDGDGLLDLLLPAESRVRVAFTGDKLGQRIETLTLPVDLEPPEDRNLQRAKEERHVEGAWFQDIDGDGRIDLLVQRSITKGSWFGSTAELMVALGTGTGFPLAQQIETDAAAVDVKRLDFDGDGDIDLLVSTIDANMGNLASALVSKAVKIQPLLYVMDGGRYGEPIKLDKLKIPIDQADRMQLEVGQDLDGDGIVDLVTNRGEDLVAVHLGRAYGFSSEPTAELVMPVPSGDDTILAHDLTGDGRAEIVVWGRGETAGRILQLR